MATVEERTGSNGSAVADRSLRSLNARDVIARVEEEGIEFVRFWFTDILGQL